MNFKNGFFPPISTSLDSNPNVIFVIYINNTCFINYQLLINNEYKNYFQPDKVKTIELYIYV